MRDQLSDDEEVVEISPPASILQQSESLLIADFMKLQEERCIAYNTLEKCMREYRENKQLCKFTGTMKQITDTFHRVSLAIIELGKDFHKRGFKESGQLIEKLQDLEEQKLKVTADEHIKLQSVNNYGKDLDITTLQEIRKKRGLLISDINEVLEEMRYRGQPQLEEAE